MAGRPTVAERAALVKERREKLAADIEAAREKQKKRERQLRAQLQQQEAAVRLAERKRRNHLVFVAGELVERAGLLECDPDLLLGGMMFLVNAVTTNSPMLADWRGAGCSNRDDKVSPMQEAAD